MPHSVKLSGLSEREEIADAIYRVALAIDTNNRELWDSAWVKDGSGYFVMNGERNDDIEGTFSKVGPMDTTHHVSNLRITIGDNGDTATATGYGMHQHYKKGDGAKGDADFLLVGCIYNLDLIKDKEEGIWRLKKWGFDLAWRQGDFAVIG